MNTTFVTTEEVIVAIENDYKSLEDTINNLLTKTDFRVSETTISTCDVNIELAIYTNPDNKEYVRWNTLNLNLKEDPFEEKDSQFKTNIGTTGEFSLDDTSKESRTNFYIQVGKLLGDTEVLNSIKEAMKVHQIAILQLREVWKNLNKKEAK